MEPVKEKKITILLTETQQKDLMRLISQNITFNLEQAPSVQAMYNAVAQPIRIDD